MDIDLFYRGELDRAVADLDGLAVDDSFSDFFTFDISRNPGQFGDASNGLNLSVAAFLGEKEFQRFNVADKHAAMIDTYGDGDRPSTRYRDLVDLVLVATTQHVNAEDLRAALLSECRHRGLGVPTTVEAPDDSWQTGYAREAAKVPHLEQQTLGAALDVANGMLQPVLIGDAAGQWSPGEQRWIDLAEG